MGMKTVTDQKFILQKFRSTVPSKVGLVVSVLVKNNPFI